MNEGVVASRYARALLKYVQEDGTGDKAYAQAGVLVLRMEEVAKLKDYVQNHDEISLPKRLELLSSALGEPLLESLERFVTLVYRNRRMECLLRMFISFIQQYRKAADIKVGRLVTACPAEGLRERLEALVQERTGARVQISAEIDEDIIGGFIFKVDDLLLDASVRTQIRRIERRLIDNNNRIV